MLGRLFTSTAAAVWLLCGPFSTQGLGQHIMAQSEKHTLGLPVLSRRDGRIDVVTGNMLWIGINKIKLDGIVTLGTTHRCNLNGRDQRCAIKMRDALVSFARRKDFRCELLLTHSGRPKFSHGGRYAALCFAGELEVNQELVARGWALAERGSAGRRYRSTEQDARANKRGIHQYELEDPRTPQSKGFWNTVEQPIKRYPLIFIGAPLIVIGFLFILLLIARWRAKQHIAKLKYELGKAQGVIETAAKSIPPRPEPIKSLAER